MVLRSLAAYVLGAFIVDVLLSIFAGLDFPLVRYAIPFLFGYVFVREEKVERQPAFLAPALLIAVVLGLVLFGPLKLPVQLFMESDYFGQLTDLIYNAIVYLFDISIFFIIGAGLGKIAGLVRGKGRNGK